MHASARQELLTIRDLIRYAVSRMTAGRVVFGHGSDNAYDEAVYLVLHALHLPPDTLDPFMDARVLREECERVLELVDRRVKERLPAAYLTNEAWLQGHRFFIDELVIVPRSPISELLGVGLSPWLGDEHNVSRALDMCTGSGCLAILTALTYPDAHVDAVDISPDALDVARRNVDDYGLGDRLSLYKADLFDGLPAAQYDLIVCNPPYVNSTSMAALPNEYRHEPQLALAGGDDGMDLVRLILRGCAQRLQDDGLLVLEIGHERLNFEIAFPDLEPIWLETEGTTDQIMALTRDQLLAATL